MITNKWQSTGTGTVTITAPSKGQLLLKTLNVISDAACNILVSSPAGTTLWQTELFAGGGGFNGEFPKDGEVIGAEKQALVITVSAGTYKISVTGVTVG